MSTARIYSRNLAINWFAHGATMLVMLFLSPFVIHTLGPAEYGVWSLLNVLTGYMGILDLGVRASTGRHVFLYFGLGDHDSVDSTIRTSLSFFTGVGILIVASGAILGWVFPSLFSSVPDQYHVLLRVLAPLMAINVWLSALSAMLSTVLLAEDRVDLARGVDLLTLVARTIATMLVLNGGYGIVGLCAVTLGCQALTLACNWRFAKCIYPRLRVWPLLLDIARLRELLRYGTAACVGTIAVKLIGPSDLVVVGAAIGVSAVAVYSVGAMLLFYSHTFLIQITQTFFPPMQRAIARGEMGPARWLYFRQVRIGLLIGIPMYVGCIVFAEPFLRLWMLGPNFGEQSVRLAALVMAILAASKLLYLFTIGADPLLAAMGRINLNAVLWISEALANLGLSLLFVLSFDFGLVGVALGTLCARLLVTTFIHPWCACREARIPWLMYLARVGGSGVAASTLFTLWCLAVRQWLSASSWPWFAGNVALALVGYVPIAFLVLMPSGDRNRLLGKLGLSVSAIKAHEETSASSAKS